jgi:hypothetical protein
MGCSALAALIRLRLVLGTRVLRGRGPLPMHPILFRAGCIDERRQSPAEASMPNWSGQGAIQWSLWESDLLLGPALMYPSGLVASVSSCELQLHTTANRGALPRLRLGNLGPHLRPAKTTRETGKLAAGHERRSHAVGSEHFSNPDVALRQWFEWSGRAAS